jgi:hypothetical protein
VVLLAALLPVSSCASSTAAGGDAARSPSVALSVPTDEVERPIPSGQLEPGTRYRFDELLPRLAVDVTGPDPALDSGWYPSVIGMSPDAIFATDSLYLAATEGLLVP